MLEHISRLIALLFCCSILFGCGYMTKQGRQQIAYAHYVKKYSHNRVKMQTKFKRVKIPKPSPENTLRDSPQSVSTGVEN